MQNDSNFYSVPFQCAVKIELTVLKNYYFYTELLILQYSISIGSIANRYSFQYWYSIAILFLVLVLAILILYIGIANWSTNTNISRISCTAKYNRQLSVENNQFCV